MPLSKQVIYLPVKSRFFLSVKEALNIHSICIQLQNYHPGSPPSPLSLQPHTHTSSTLFQSKQWHSQRHFTYCKYDAGTIWTYKKGLIYYGTYSLPWSFSQGTRRTNLSPQDQAKYRLSLDQAHVHVSSPGLCKALGPFTGFSSSTTLTSSKKHIE